MAGSQVVFRKIIRVCGEAGRPRPETGRKPASNRLEIKLKAVSSWPDGLEYAYYRCETPITLARVMAVHPNSLANLRPPWQPGESGNEAGRKPAGQSILEWINEHATDTEAEIKLIAKDASQPIYIRMAAGAMLGAARQWWTKGKRDAGDDFDRILDRTIGKPVQSLVVERVQPDDPAVLEQQLRGMLDRSPELAALFGAGAPAVAEAEALPPADEAVGSAE